LRDQRGGKVENKKPSSRQNENEGIQRIPSAHAERAGLILLLTEKLGMTATVIDRRYNARTSAIKSVS
jgi:hypothetical protein